MIIRILLAAIVGMVVGALWYGPLFGRIWMGMIGYTEKDIRKAKKQGGMSKNYLIAFLGVLVMSMVLKFFIDIYNANVLDGILIGALAWLGFIASTSINSVLWERKSWNLWLLGAAHYLVVLVLMGAILAW